MLHMRNGRSSKAHIYRLPYAVEVYKNGLVSKIIVSGGRNIGNANMVEADYLKEKAIESAIKNEDILVENKAMTPWEKMKQLRKCRFLASMKIITFEEKYRDDLIFMILEAKDALGRVPGLNEDLLDIQKNYMYKGGMFWIAVDENDRVIGSVGVSMIDNSKECYIHRLFVKYNQKYNGIGTKLLTTAEEYAKKNRKTATLVHLGKPKEQWFESWKFYPKNGYVEIEDSIMRKEL